MPSIRGVKVEVVHLDAAKSSVQWAVRNAAASGLCGIVTTGVPSSSGNANDIEVVSSDIKDTIDEKKTEKKEINNSISEDELLIFKNNDEGNNIENASNDSDNDNEIDIDSITDSGNPSARWITDDCISFLEREIRRKNKYDGLIFDPPAFGRALNGKIWKLEKDLPVLVEELIPKLLSADPLFVLLSCHDVTWPAERLAETLSVAMSNMMKNTMLLNIKLNKKNKINSIDKNNLLDKNNHRNKEKKLDKKNSNANSVTNSNLMEQRKKNEHLIQNQNSDIKSVFLAGGILEYGPMILKPKGKINSTGKLEIGNSLPLGCFARWSKIID